MTTTSSPPVPIPRLTFNSPAPGQVVLHGVVDERAGLERVLTYAEGGKLNIDLADVSYINSLGVRDWINLMNQATSQGIAIELHRVCEPIVQQLNMILATRGKAHIASFYAPYACDHCGREESLLIDTAASAASLAAGQPPDAKCPECGSTMAFNDFPERYFAFLTYADPCPS